MDNNRIRSDEVCHCGRPATHMVSNGVVTLRTCHLHAHKAAIDLKAAVRR